MAFLDNSGDIILDAVLTDTGRMRLARGDGSFKISKFALGDDEIDYESYNGGHSSGSAYYDLEILQTPIFEAFTNNTSNMKSKLVSLTNNNLLYLPVMVINDTQNDNGTFAPTAADAIFGSGSHVLIVDADTNDALKGQGSFSTVLVTDFQGYLNGQKPITNGNAIRVDQGLNTTEISPALLIDPELKETQYIIELDSRFAKIYDKGTAEAAANPSFIDDDSVASYYVTLNVGDFVKNSVPGKLTDVEVESKAEVIKGPRGTNLTFGLLAATDLVTSDYLFNTLGSSVAHAGNTFKFIDSNIRVTGVTTGYRLDIPIRYLKVS